MSQIQPRTVLAFVLLAVIASGCSTVTDPGDSDTSEMPSATLQSDNLTELESRIVVGSPPKNLVWEIAPPSSWGTVVNEPGQDQWQIEDSKCAFTALQPDGLDLDPTIDGEDLIVSYVTRTADSMGAVAEVGETSIRMFPITSPGLDVSAEVGVVRADFTIGPGEDIRGEAYGYRSGDYGLVLLSICGGGEFDQVNRDEFEPLIADHVGIVATY